MSNIDFKYRSVEQHGHPIHVLSVVGHIDATTFPKFKDTLVELVTKSSASVVLDLEQCTYINSTGFGMLATACRKLQRAGFTFVLSGLSSKVKHIYLLLGLNHVVLSYPDETSAINALTGE